jgi:tetratricopeptide (TPR) repeat protein
MRFKPAGNISHLQSTEGGEHHIGRESGLLLFLFAIGFRLIYILQSFDNPLFGIPIVDAHVYADWAERMVQGVWLWDHVGNYLPVYPAFLAVVQLVLGPSALAVKVVQSLMGAVGALLMAQVAARAWNRRVGLITGYLLATYWMLTVFESERYAESFSIFFQTLALWLLVCRHRQWWAVTAAGFAFALSAGARANLFLILPVIVAWLVWQGRSQPSRDDGLLPGRTAADRTPVRDAGLAGPPAVVPLARPPGVPARNKVRMGPQSPWKNDEGAAANPGRSGRQRGRVAAGIKAAALFCIGTLVIIGPILIQNYRVSGALMLRAQGTWSLYSGISPEFDGLHPPTGILFDKYMHLPYRAGLRSEAEIERFWGEKIIEVLRKDPLGVAVNGLRRLVIFLNAREWSQEFDVYRYRSYSGFLSLPWTGFWLVGPLSLLGFCRLRRVSRVQWLIIGWTAVGFLSIIPFKVSDRYRLPTAVLLTCFAALALWQLYTWYRAADRKNLRRSLALLAVFCMLCWPDWQDLAARKTARHEFYVGLQYESNHRYEQALPYYEASMQAFDWDPDSPYRIGHILLKQGNTGRALVYLLEALEREPQFPKAINDVARIYLREDLPDTAEARLQESLQLNPLEKDTLVLLADIRRRRGDVAAELEYLRRAAFELRNAESTVILADRLTELGYYEDALASYTHVMNSREAERYLRVRAATKAGYTAARFFQDAEKAVYYWNIVSGEFRDFRFFALQADFLRGALGETEFVQAMGDDPQWQPSAFYAVGLRRRLAGDRDGAAAAFKQCLAGTDRSAGRPEKIPQKWAWEDLQKIVNRRHTQTSADK